MNYENKESVTIRLGFAAYGLAGLSFLFGIVILIWFLTGLFPFNISNPWYASPLTGLLALVLCLPLASIFLFFAASLLKQKYIVSLKGIHVHRLTNSRFIDWQEVKVFNIIPTFMGANMMKIFLHDGTDATLLIPFLANYPHSAKAIVEAAYLANPSMEMNFVLGNDYGPPPYGIFSDQDSES